MFFTLSKTLNVLAFPLVLGLILLVLAWGQRRRRPRLAAWCFWIAILGLYLPSTRPVADLIIMPLEAPYEGLPRPSSADAIVVMGGAANLGRTDAQHLEFNPAGSRFVEGVLLARDLPGAKLIFSGGSGSLFYQEKKEAPLLRDFAVRLGVPPEQILTDDRSRNTYENVVETKRILDANGLRFVVVITSAYHMKRSLACFHAVGVSPIACPVNFTNTHPSYGLMCWVPTAATLEDSSRALKEHIGLLIYRIKGYAAP